MKILQVWTGYTSGTYMGRNDGHPETKLRLYTDPVAAVKDQQPGGKFFYVDGMPISDVTLARYQAWGEQGAGI